MFRDKIGPPKKKIAPPPKRHKLNSDMLMLSPRGQGLILAIKEGLVKEVPGGYDDELFNQLWDIFETVYMLKDEPRK